MRKYDLIRHMEKVHAISYNCKSGKRNRQIPEDSPSKEVDEFFRENKEIVRKRRPINFSLQDLDDDETADENWNAKPKAKRNGFTSPKGQLISKCPFGVFKSSKKTNKMFVRISALAF